MLCDQIIQQQRGLVKEHALPIPDELEELYDHYLQLNDAGEMSAGTPTQLNPTKLQSVANLMKVFEEMEVETIRWGTSDYLKYSSLLNVSRTYCPEIMTKWRLFLYFLF